jgi:hypothetical protein
MSVEPERIRQSGDRLCVWPRHQSELDVAQPSHTQFGELGDSFLRQTSPGSLVRQEVAH